MKPTILKKCVEELQKDPPNIPYVLGMLETFIELMPSVTLGPAVVMDWSKTATHTSSPDKLNPSLDHVDEEIIPEIAKPGPIGKLG